MKKQAVNTILTCSQCGNNIFYESSMATGHMCVNFEIVDNKIDYEVDNGDMYSGVNEKKYKQRRIYCCFCRHRLTQSQVDLLEILEAIAEKERQNEI